uniref:Cyclin Dx n=1 Tax=Sphaeramia orbicularis TaxID=375764 RepID=A0A672Z0P5_9TELE
NTSCCSSLRVRRQLRAAWDPLCQGHRVIQRLLQVEERYMPSMLYVTLIQRDPERREELTKWAMEVRKLSPPSLLPVISSCSRTQRSCLPVCLCPSSPTPKLSLCVLFSSLLTCPAPSPQEMERVILAPLRWDTASVTPQDFLHTLFDCEELLSTLRRHSDTLSAMCACDSAFLGAPPSLVAAASLNCALRGLGNKEASELVHMTEALAELCQTDPVSPPKHFHTFRPQVSNMRPGGQIRPAKGSNLMEPERPGTPTDMREIDF